MRREVKRIIGVKAGKTIEITCKLPKNLSFSGVAIFSSENGGEFSPYIPNLEKKLTIPIIGKTNKEPRMLSPIYFRINGEGNKKSIKIIAQKNVDFAVMQECDLFTDLLLIVKVKTHGKTTEKIRQFLRNAKWAVRSCYEKRLFIK